MCLWLIFGCKLKVKLAYGGIPSGSGGVRCQLQEEERTAAPDNIGVGWNGEDS